MKKYFFTAGEDKIVETLATYYGVSFDEHLSPTRKELEKDIKAYLREEADNPRIRKFVIEIKEIKQK